MSTLAGACTDPPASPTAGPTGDLEASATRDVGGGATTSEASPAAPAPPPSTDPVPEEADRTSAAPSPCDSEPLIGQVDWIELDGRPSLEVRPTQVLRECGRYGAAEQAWQELLEVIPDADTDGMQEQFTCHVLFAPTKDVWHLEPWRPVVEGPELLAARCNPGGPDPDLG